MVFTGCSNCKKCIVYQGDIKDSKMNGRELAEKLVTYASAHLHLDKSDRIYVRNLLLSRFGDTEPFVGSVDTAGIDGMEVPDLLADQVREFALANGLCTEETAERYVADLFGILTPLPSEINRRFFAIKEQSGAQAACDDFYNLCVSNGYIQKTAIARNLKWEYRDGKKRVEITVNLSKPEKNNKEIAKLLSAPQEKKYPACALCHENEGFEGTATHPPRRNLRTVRLTLGGGEWFMQYSPYAYYDEHCIVINENHVPMKVDTATPNKLLDFVDCFPNYFIGSNASLPIVGGSILNHEHFQGGKHLLPMHTAEIRKEYKSPEYPGLTVGILDWYNSAIVCKGRDRAQIAAFASKVIDAWQKFDCPECDIQSHTGITPHNTLSPICRKTEDGYIFSMILRNNRTSEQYPDGIFHVHPEYRNIKSEGIGLIEAMGLFILPPRLKRQFGEMEKLLTNEVSYRREEIEDPGHDLYVHRDMIETLLNDGYATTREEAWERIQAYVNRVCVGILGNTAVFKQDARGNAGFEKFMNSLGLKGV